MTVIQAIRLNIYTLRALRSDESAGYIALVRTSDRIPDLSARDTDAGYLRSAEIPMDGDEKLVHAKSGRRLFRLMRPVRRLPRVYTKCLCEK
jgi:hypothetical protein